MAITTLTDDLNIIAALDDEPNDVGGLTPEQAKAKFDEGTNAIKTFVNSTLIPELDAAHLPYQYGSPNSIKDTVDGVALGAIPDNSFTFEKIASTEIASEAEAQTGTATDKLMTPQRTAQAIAYREFPYEVVTASWSETVTAGATVTKTIAHTLGAVPSKLRLFFYKGKDMGEIEILFNGTSYNYAMRGTTHATTSSVGYGAWRQDHIVGKYLFGQYSASANLDESVAGTALLNARYLRLGAITVSDSEISIPITNPHSSSQSLGSALEVEVYA